MIITLTVFASSLANEERLIAELKTAVGRLVEISFLRAPELGQLILIDEDYPGIEDFLEKLAEKGDRRGRAVFLITRDFDQVPEILTGGAVDDVVIHPFRSLEVLSKVRNSQQILMWDEVHQINASFSEALVQLKDDLKLAERLQKSKLPLRFPDIRGFKITHRYIAGIKAGGDHFDLAESKDGQQLSLVLSDSSSYGLSSAVLSTLMRVVMRLSSDEIRSPSETVRRVQEELKATLTERDRLSLFYGVISRKDYRLRFVNLGSSSAFYAPVGRKFAALPAQGAALSAVSVTAQNTESAQIPEAEVLLEPQGKLALISDGFLEAAGGALELLELLNEFRDRETIDLLNELVFRAKKNLAEDDLPSQDCTATIFDLDARLIRLAH
jgi:hypothetical protein